MGSPLPQIVERTGLTRSTLYRHLPPRPATALTVAVPAGQYACQVDVTKSVEPAELVAHDQPPRSKRVHPPPVERLLTCLLRRGWCCGT